MEDLYSSENDDSLEIASRSWQRVINAAIKTGYREGIQDGADSVLQESFDLGYKDGFKTAFMLGKYKSLSMALSSSLKHPDDIAVILDKTRQGSCWICNTVSQDPTSNTDEDMSFSEVMNNQRIYSTEVINKLHKYFQSKGFNIETDLH